MIKAICTTSDKYLHLIPVFTYLFTKYWPGQTCEIVGYKSPGELPPGFTFVSLGTQGQVSEWSTDLRRYFEQQPDWFVWLFEDTFLKRRVDKEIIGRCLFPVTGRIDLSGNVQKREHTNDGTTVTAHQNSRYRLSTQPSIWNKKFLLQYLTPGLSPWEFETQDPNNDGWDIIGFTNPPVHHNEGVRRFDIHKLDLDGMTQQDIDHIKSIAPWLK